jgi:hypothetical protein
VDAIAERRLELRSAGPTIEVVARLGRPEPHTPLNCWKCEYELALGGHARRTDIYGEDSLQALQLSMVTLDGELKLEAKARGGVLWHLDEPFTSLLEDSGLQLKPLKAG